MPGRWWAALLILAATVALYLGYVVRLGAEMGFPLDDSWIHQTFARNLVQRGELAYNLGEPSTASTSPLWTLLLTLGYMLPGGFRLWAYVLGLLFLGLTSWVGYHLYRQLFPHRAGFAVLAALAILLEWRLNWAALSGMETILFAFTSLGLIYLAVLALRGGLSTSRICLLGVMAGLTTVVRPEGIALAMLALGVLFWRHKPKRWVAAPIGLALVVLVPLLVFNFTVSGTPLPSTFYAKHAAYAQSLSPGFIASYLARAVGVLAEGPLAILLPGVAYIGYRVVASVSSQADVGARSFKWKDRAPTVAPFVFIGFWVVGLLLLYMWRLPALFHHGRYLMPLIPPLLVVGLGGLVALAETIPYRQLTRVYTGLAVLMFLVLWANGAVIYGWDVKFIGDEEVATAKWLEKNVSPEAVVATHDVGAMGYFSGKKIVDTAGLITPDLGPYVRDQARILSYLESSEIDYLAVFPRWYPKIVGDPRFEEVFSIEHAYATRSGADNMRVYRAKW